MQTLGLCQLTHGWRQHILCPLLSSGRLLVRWRKLSLGPFSWQLCLGPLSDMFGRRWFFIAGNILALIGGIVCSTAHSVRVVIIGMSFLGAGAAHQQMALAALAEIYPNKYRGVVQGMWKERFKLKTNVWHRDTGNRSIAFFRMWLSDRTHNGQKCNMEMGLLS